jgi:hypothetical protein
MPSGFFMNSLLGACAAEAIRLQRRCHRLIGSIVRLA